MALGKAATLVTTVAEQNFSPRLKSLVLKEVSDKSKLDEDFLPVNRNPLSPKFYTRLFLEIKKISKRARIH